MPRFTLRTVGTCAFLSPLTVSQAKNVTPEFQLQHSVGVYVETAVQSAQRVLAWDGHIALVRGDKGQLWPLTEPLTDAELFV